MAVMIFDNEIRRMIILIIAAIIAMINFKNPEPETGTSPRFVDQGFASLAFGRRNVLDDL